MGELTGQGYREADVVAAWRRWNDLLLERGSADPEGEFVELLRECEPADLPELGYSPPLPGDELGYWTLRVRGGGAFLANAAATLARLAADRPDGPMRGCLERLAMACEESAAAEDAKVGLHDG